MCITLPSKLGEEMGQNRHCPAVNDGMVEPGELVGCSKDGGIELVSGIEGRLIGKVWSDVAEAEVVAVVAPSIRRK